MSGKSASKKLALSALFIALGLALSVWPGSIPIGPTKIYPFQHMVNGLVGVILGPWYGAFIAFAIGTLRIGFGVGTIFAYPGGIPGAIVVGLFYHYLLKRDLAALTEPIGTGIGALISALLVAPMLGVAFPPTMGLTVQWQIFLVLFWMSSVPGAVIGFLILAALRRRGILARIQV